MLLGKCKMPSFNWPWKPKREPEEDGAIDVFRQMVELKLLETERRIQARRRMRKVWQEQVRQDLYEPTSELGKLLRAMIWSGGNFGGSTFQGVNLLEALKQADKLGPPRADTPFVERAKQFDELGNNLIYEHANALSCLTTWCLTARQMLDGQDIVIPEKGFTFHMSPDFVSRLSNLFTDSMDLIGVETYVQAVKPMEREEENNEGAGD